MNLQRSPNTFQRFPKILQKLSEGQTNVFEHFPKCSKILRSNDVSIIQQYISTFQGIILP